MGDRRMEVKARILKTAARHYLTGQDRRGIIAMVDRFLKTGNEHQYGGMWSAARDVAKTNRPFACACGLQGEGRS